MLDLSVPYAERVVIADTFDRATNRITDINGYWNIPRNPISRVGVFDYLGKSIGAPEPNRIYKVYRPAEELGSDACLDSFRGMPLVDDHTMIGDGPGCIPAERKGIHGSIGDDVQFDGVTLYGNLRVWSSSMKNAVDNAGKVELSAGYRCSYDFTPGTFQGVNYDVVQRQMRGNHLALVDKGRMGPDVRVLDGSLEFTVDAKEFVRMDPELKAILDKLASGMDTALATVAALPALDAKVTALDAKVTALDADEPAELSEEDKKAAADKEAADRLAADAALTTLVTKAVDSVLAAHKITPPPASTGNDAREVIAGIHRGAAMAKRLEPFVGTFDHSTMDEMAVAKYGATKLTEAGKAKLTDVADAAVVNVVDAWLQAAQTPSPIASRERSEPGSAVSRYGKKEA